MGNIAQKLEYLKDTKEAIKTAIVGKGGSIAEDANFRSYAETITNLPSGGGDDIEPIVLTGDCSRACSGLLAEQYIKVLGNKITSTEISDAMEMFFGYQLDSVPFELNFKLSKTYSNELTRMFSNARNITEPPKMNNVYVGTLTYMFNGCDRLREFPEDYFDNWDFSYCQNQTSQWLCNWSMFVQQCASLRQLPMKIFEYANPYAYYSHTFYGGLMRMTYALDEAKDIPIPYEAEYTSNIFSDMAYDAYRVKDITFKMPEGKPYVKRLKGQTIDIANNIGFANAYYGRDYILNYNSGITADKEVYDDATYQALKNDPDWFSTKIEYSRYNKTSAVNTINSLPDTSAYLLENGGTNTIKFKGIAGSLTDGGAINTMTAEEIAVATAKGWTVSLV